MSDLYIGRTVPDSKTLNYPARDLVTHGVCVGMTGSGKTGLCIWPPGGAAPSRRRLVGTGVRSGARAYGRIRKADEDIKESEEKIAAWTRDRDTLQAEREEALSAAWAQAAAAAGALERTRLPVNRSDVRVVEWYVLWS